MEHFCQWSISKSWQWLAFLLHIQKINGERKPNIDPWVERSKVNIPATLWLHFLSDRISLLLKITDASTFVNRWRMMIWKRPEHQRTKKLLVKVNNGCFPTELCVFVILLWILQALELRTCSLLLMCGELSMFWNILFPLHRLFYMHSTRMVKYRTSHAIPSNGPTDVSLHWTWFKVGNQSQ